jgi:hypothetical protein
VNDFTEKYRLEEMKALRSEINIQIQEMYKLENFAIISIGAVASVVFLSGNPRLPGIGWFLAFAPIVVVAYCWIRAASIRHLIGHMDAYLMRVESNLLPLARDESSQASEVKGWVAYYKKHATGYEKREQAFWIMLFGASALLFALYGAIQKGILA